MTRATSFRKLSPQAPYGTAPDTPPFTQAVSRGVAWNNHPIVHGMTLGQTLDQTVRFFGNQDGLVYPEHNWRLTWNEFSDYVDELARGLMALGIDHGDKIAVWATNIPEYVPLMYATAKIGAVFIPVNMNFKKNEIDGILKKSDTKYLFCIEGFRDYSYTNALYELIPGLEKRGDDAEIKSEEYPFLKRVFYISKFGEIDTRKGFNKISDILRVSRFTSYEDYLDRQNECRDDNTCCMQFTSGTTGTPKGVMLTHRNIGNDGYWIGACQNLSSRDRVCIPVPLFHCFGMVLGIMACVNNGSTIVMLEKYDPIKVMSAIQSEKCTSVYGVPTMYIAMLDHPDFEKYDFSSLRTGIMSGATCPVVRMQQCVEKMFMKEITIPYGLTETGPVMTQTRYFEPDIEKKCFSIGQALPGVEVAIINPETGKFCEIGEDGEICCRGFNVMKGYYKDPLSTYQLLDQFGWLHSGDIGKMDEQGYYYITGRLKDLIIRGGENISPKEVEDFMGTIPGIADIQLVGVPSKKYGEQPAAFIIRTKESNITEEEVLAACKDKISWFKIPKYIAFVEEYPLTASGKIQKYKLREIAAEMWPDA
ncbi:MAG: AMP-binding protein [Treponemataceae bacterium]|nr:AMP-binding protein [Treponemataceae bacterium]